MDHFDDKAEPLHWAVFAVGMLLVLGLLLTGILDAM